MRSRAAASLVAALTVVVAATVTSLGAEAGPLMRTGQTALLGSSRVATRLAEAAAQTSKLSDPSQLTETAPDVYRARFDTSKGSFVIDVHREWAPIGADRFYNLVKNGFYDGTRFFRVRPGFMAQFGLHGDAGVQSAWQRANLRDEPPMKSNTRGFVSFAKESLPNTRFTQIFVNYADNSYLDEMGFAPFGQVVSGMEIVDKIFGYPRESEPDQRRILREGNEYLKEFPKLDFVKKASIVPLTPAAPARRRPS